MMRSSICNTLLAMVAMGCRPGGVGSELSDGSDTGGSDTGDLASCEAWSNEFVVGDQALIPPNDSICGGAVVLPAAAEDPSEVVVFVSPDNNDVTGVAVRFAIAPDGKSQLLESTGPTSELPQDVFAFDDLLVASYRVNFVSGDTGGTEYGGSLWLTDGPISLDRVFPEFPVGGLPPIAAATTSPGVIDIYFSNGTSDAVEHWRHEAGVLAEVGQLAVPGVVRALLLDDLDGDQFVDLIAATEDGLHLLWADAMGVSMDDSSTLELQAANSLAAGNIDGDPERELLAVLPYWSSDTTNEIHVFDNLGGRDFAETLTEEAGLMLGPNSGTLFWGHGRPRALLTDLDDDGLDDLIYVDAPLLDDPYAYGDHRVLARRSCGDGSFGAARLLFSHDGRIADLSVVDFSRDGLADLILYSDATMITLQQQGG